MKHQKLSRAFMQLYSTSKLVKQVNQWLFGIEDPFQADSVLLLMVIAL